MHVFCERVPGLSELMCIVALSQISKKRDKCHYAENKSTEYMDLNVWRYYEYVYIIFRGQEFLCPRISMCKFHNGCIQLCVQVYAGVGVMN